MAEGRSSIYFDNAATSYPKPEEVYQAVDSFMREVGGSAGRSGHKRAVEAGRMVFGAREALAGLIGASDPLRIAFAKNATEAINVAVWGLLKPGSHAVVSSVEHNSVMRPLEAAKARGASYTAAPCSPDGYLDPVEVERAIRPETALVIVNHVSNVTGTILPVADIAQVARGRGIPLLVDAAQSAGRVPIDVEADGIDILAFTGHKELFGPQGTGGFYVREGLEVGPLMYGGTGSHSSEIEQPSEVPDRFESGTLNAAGIAGLAAGVRFVAGVGIGRIRKHELELVGRLLDGLEKVGGVTVYGPGDQDRRVGIVALTMDGYSTAEIAELLDGRYGISCRAGLHCSPAAHSTIGTLDTGAVRVSFSYLNTAEEVDYLIECLVELATA